MMTDPKNPSDNFLIACSSFEERSLGLAKSLDQRYLAGTIIIFVYDEDSNLGDREKYLKELIETLSSHTKVSVNSNKKLHVIYCNRENALDGLTKFQKLMTSENISLKNKTVLMDISVFTKQYLLVLLKYLDTYLNMNIRIAYTSPKNYVATPLTLGIRRSIIVPSYEGEFSSLKRNLLILFLGYEGDRAYNLYETQSANKTICILGIPSIRPEWGKTSIDMNKKLLSSQNVETISCSNINYNDVFNQLEKIHLEYSKNYNISISPLGTKMQTLGLYLFCKKHPDVRIIYAIPAIYSPLGYSSGIDKSNVYPL